MILAALRQLAIDEGLVDNPAYENKAVHFEIVLGEGGQFLAMSPLGNTADKKWNGAQQSAPRSPPGTRKSGQTIDPSFLIGNSSFVLGRDAPADANKKSFPPDELARRRDAFRELIDAAAAAVPADEGLAAVAKFLHDLANGGADVPPEPRMMSNHLIAFRYKPDIDFAVHESETVARYWQARLTPAESGSAGETFQCLVSGAIGEALRSHPVVQKVPGGNTTGVRLVSFNAPAFTSYGLEQSHNAPVSQSAANAYTEALRRLMNPGYPDPRHVGRSLDSRSFRVSDETAIAFWAAGNQDAVSLFGAALADPGMDEAKKNDHTQAVAAIIDPKAVESNHLAPWRGCEVPLSVADQRHFYTLTLSGAEARAVIRGWHETTLGAVVKNLQTYFKDIEIGRSQQKDGRPPCLALRVLLSSVGIRTKDNEGKIKYFYSANLAERVFRSSISGSAFPRDLIVNAVARLRSPGSANWNEPARVGWIKAYLNRERRFGRLPLFPELKPMIDESCHNTAYRLGRLFAVLEKVQGEAIDASATIRDRYYGAASATPRVVFPQLLRKLPAHLKNAKRPAFYEKLVQEIVHGLPAQSFPATLNLEEQGLFAIGYYHESRAVWDAKMNDLRNARYYPDAPKKD